ncbi:FMN-binding negative transcriptional regulator [Thalassotalea sediminis]|uniref:FMN-binding negative transcriptional regulator n=1 Tax=Thalassotalea sediminis TaxID=1759089 RepID=UPI0025737C9F|nr:FMN-binding negative transcriptional regulator [Thalassotalea sediminis]
MYVPKNMEFPSESSVIAFIEQYSFATLVSPNLQATRLPLFYEKATHCLFGHFARANAHWKTLTDGNCLAIFDGPHDYISPTWYEGSPNVPTWNYASVHVQGKATLLNAQETANALNKLMEKYEPSLLDNRDIVTPEYQQKLAKGIVGFSISIKDIDAKAKLGQHRSTEDQQGVAHALASSKSIESQALYALMQQWQIGLGNSCA